MADRPETTKSRKAARLGELRAKRIAAAAATAAASTTIVETTETPVNEDASEPPPQGDAAAAAALPSNTPPEPYAMSVTAPVLDPMVLGGGFGGAPSVQAPADESADISATVSGPQKCHNVSHQICSQLAVITCALGASALHAAPCGLRGRSSKRTVVARLRPHTATCFPMPPPSCPSPP